MSTTIKTPKCYIGLCRIGGKRAIEFLPEFNKILAEGLSNGVRDDDGRVCIEAAVGIAFGEWDKDDPSDSPACVDSNLRGFKIGINDDGNFGTDANSSKARARALYALGIAQLGTAIPVIDTNTGKQKFTKAGVGVYEDDPKFWPKFKKAFVDAWVKRTGESEDDAPAPNWIGFECSSPKRTLTVIDSAVDALITLKTPGSKWLKAIGRNYLPKGLKPKKATKKAKK
jgi:hypothetical protein